MQYEVLNRKSKALTVIKILKLEIDVILLSFLFIYRKTSFVLITHLMLH